MSKPLRVITVVGARPQFIKAAAVSREVRASFYDQIEEKIIHTGQHFDENMSQVFFDELAIPKPHYQFNISGLTHGVMTGKMLESIEAILLKEKPDWVMVYGDTNSTLAGALAAAKLHIPVAHIEAGLRSFNMRMPEEINRILSDRVSSQLYCPTDSAVSNLAAEGITRGVQNVGDVMYDVALYYKARARAESKIQQKLKILPGSYVLTTCHRAENTDDRYRLSEILRGLTSTAKKMPVILPLHPRTRKLIQDFQLENLLTSLIVTDPLPFLDMVALEQDAALIITDSGGVQKEAFFYDVPCITMRDETEWVETVSLGWNKLVGAKAVNITKAVDQYLNEKPKLTLSKPYGDGNASNIILNCLIQS